ncbi:g5463 [Coccomyxa viridis]|uniref:G5463 protein n=1 Tax=Coccomyxa viridis TaxID=1274662 RepID=A0ABP1FY09_9CHLO
MDFPGGRVPFTDQLHFEGGPFTQRPPLSCYRTLDSKGHSIPEAQVLHPVDKELALRMYTSMVKLQTMDVIFYEAQRQGRFSFFMTSNGEEATAIGSAAALLAEDHVFSQYREHGVLLYRGFSFLDMANQCFGNVRGHGKGRQMPIHYGSKALNFQTVSAPLATQMPHAVGAAYALKMQGQKAVVAVYFGEGAASEGDFHAALNFAATLSAPVLFICRNNGWAISTPATEQYRGDGIAGRGPSYGIPSIRVDGGDAQAVYNATLEAREIALEHSSPVLIEAMSYRSGHHSTSDDSSRYRTAEEMQEWRARDPVTRFQAFLDEAGWWDSEKEKSLRVAVRKEVVEALTAAQKVGKPPLSDLFTDVYKEMPWHLAEQQEDAYKHAQQHPEYLHGVPLS